MGWPRKDEEYRLYKEPKRDTNGGTYLLVYVREGIDRGTGGFPCLGELRTDNDPERPMLCSGDVAPRYLYQCRRVAWEDLPEPWRRVFCTDLMRTDVPEYTPRDPATIRGLHRTSRRGAA